MFENKLKRRAALVGLGLVGVIVVGALMGSDSAADDLRPKAEKALDAAGLGEIAVDFEGREAHLSGGTSADLARAETIVESIRGVRWATVDRGGVVAPATAPYLTLRRTSGGLEISGTVPSADAALELKSSAAEAFGLTVTGDLAVDPSVGSAPWTDELPEVFGDIVGVEDLVLEIDGGGTLELAGSIESQEGADKLHELVEAAVPDLELVSTIRADAGALSAADASILNSTTLYFARGSFTLSEANMTALDTVADVLARNPGVTVVAGGHAGPSDPVKGLALSDARVAAVKAYLVQAGIDAARITTRSYGSDTTTTTDAFAERYRRVDFVIEGN